MKRAILASVVAVVLAVGITVGVWPSGKAHATGTVTLALGQTVVVASNIDVPTGPAQSFPTVYITKACVHLRLYLDGDGNLAPGTNIAGLVGQVGSIQGGGDSAPSVTVTIMNIWNPPHAPLHLNNLYLFCGK